jgi:hypothetical protein
MIHISFIPVFQITRINKIRQKYATLQVSYTNTKKAFFCALHEKTKNDNYSSKTSNNGHIEHNDDSLIRTHKQQTTQQVTTVTKVVREVKHLTGDNCIDGQQVDYVDCGPDGQPLDYVPLPLGAYPRYEKLE